MQIQKVSQFQHSSLILAAHARRCSTPKRLVYDSLSQFTSYIYIYITCNFLLPLTLFVIIVGNRYTYIYRYKHRLQTIKATSCRVAVSTRKRLFEPHKTKVSHNSRRRRLLLRCIILCIYIIIQLYKDG
jgi:hypothetical protein